MNLDSIWSEACRSLENSMGAILAKTFITNALTPINCDDGKMYLSACTQFHLAEVRSKYLTQLEDALSRACGQLITAVLLLPQEAEDYKRGRFSAANTEEAKFNPKYTFDTFVVGSNNSFAHAAAVAVANAPADAYNPLFIYGGVGLGKTHLMHAIGHYIMEKNPHMRIQYVTCEKFMNEMVDSINRRTQTQFHEKYRNNDVLMVDDIQFLAGKTGTQEEFFHTFNELHQAGRQIVLSSDRSPREIPQLEERLSSRFAWGLVADIGKPDIETRIAILQRKAQEELINVPGEVLQLIAENVQTNIRELEGCLSRLSMYSNLTGRKIDCELVREALKETFEKTQARKVTCADVMNAVASYYNVTLDDLRSEKRNREIARPRQLAMYLVDALVGMPLVSIGNEFGGRDHSTVRHAVTKIAEDVKQDPELSTLVNDLKDQLTGGRND